MADNEPQITRITAPRKDAKENIKRYDSFLFWASLIGIGLFAIAITFFCWNQAKWLLDTTINHDLWAHAGDFIGGVIGTILTFLTLYLMIRTLQNQIGSTDKAQSVSEQQLAEAQEQRKTSIIQNFDTQYRSFYDIYRQAKEKYKVNDERGEEAINQLCNQLLEAEISDKLVYGKKIKAAVREYETIYARNIDYMSVHWLTLYHLLQFISEFKEVDETVKVRYAKAIRSNFTKSEMILLRYNSNAAYGQKMQKYINEFNMLKHQPLTDLPEFAKWIKLFKTEKDEKKTALNTFFVELRKKTKSILVRNSETAEIHCGKHWTFHLSATDDRTIFTIKITLNRKQSRKGDYIPYIEKALDEIGYDEVSAMISAVIREIFFYSNYKTYNNTETLKLTSEESPKGQTRIFRLSSPYPIIIAQQQLSRPQ